MICPKCQTTLRIEDINIKTDVGLCSKCQHLFKISEHIEPIFNDNFDMNNPPKGAWINNGFNELTIGASTRSPIAFFLVPFMIVWSGGSLGGIYGTQIVSGKFSLFMSLFGIPFVIGSIIFWSLALMSIWGKVEIKIDKLGGVIFTGLGKFGIKKTFSWDDVSTVRESVSNLKYPGSNGGDILIEGKKRISFGKGLNQSKRYYLYRSLNQIVEKVKQNKNFF